MINYCKTCIVNNTARHINPSKKRNITQRLSFALSQGMTQLVVYKGHVRFAKPVISQSKPDTYSAPAMVFAGPEFFGEKGLGVGEAQLFQIHYYAGFYARNDFTQLQEW